MIVFLDFCHNKWRRLTNVSVQQVWGNSWASVSPALYSVQHYLKQWLRQPETQYLSGEVLCRRDELCLEG